MVALIPEFDFPATNINMEIIRDTAITPIVPGNLINFSFKYEKAVLKRTKIVIILNISMIIFFV